MQTRIPEADKRDPDIAEADAILRSCVHCGFCNATCPTYLELGDERDGPRGRIYLIKQLLEGGPATEATQRHLDRCLTCRNCETTCPSGVEYGRLVDIGRNVIDRRVERPAPQRAVRWLIKRLVPYRRRFGALLGLGRRLKPVLPARLRAKVPAARAAGEWPRNGHARRMLVLEGCVQAVATPATNAAAARVLDRLGIELVPAPGAGCCGAVSYHLPDHDDARRHMRRNIDAWWPEIENGAEAVVATASGCGVMLREYAQALRDDPAYAAKASRLAALVRDIGEVIAAEDLTALALEPPPTRLAVHTPCTLQHGQKLPDLVEAELGRAGFRLTATRDRHLCCGSAGTYSLLQPSLSRRFRDDKLAALTCDSPDCIVTGNIGCQLHLESGTTTPVRHWIELLDEACTARAPGNVGDGHESAHGHAGSRAA